MGGLPISVEDALDRCVVAMREGGKSIDECLAEYPDYRESLEPLLNLTARLSVGQTLQPSPKFQKFAYARMQNQLAARPRRKARAYRQPSFGLQDWLRQPRPAFAVSLLIVIFIFFASAGVSQAASGALPGEKLYPVKVAVEEFRLFISISNVDDSRLNLAFAEKRLDEVQALQNAQANAAVEPALARYQEQVSSILATIETGGHLTVDEQVALAEMVIARLEANDARLESLLARAAEEERPVIRAALDETQRGRFIIAAFLARWKYRADQLPEWLIQTATQWVENGWVGETTPIPPATRVVTSTVTLPATLVREPTLPVVSWPTRSSTWPTGPVAPQWPEITAWPTPWPVESPWPPGIAITDWVKTQIAVTKKPGTPVPVRTPRPTRYPEGAPGPGGWQMEVTP